MNISKNKVSLKTKLSIALLATFLTSCTTYKSGFACDSAKGMACTSMDKVDRMIASGEIDRFNEPRKKCRGRGCKRKAVEDDMVLQPITNHVMPIHFINRNIGE
jgi:hypothetical protein